MRNHFIESEIHPRKSDLTPRDILINLLEEEGDDLGWEEEQLIYEAAMRIEDYQDDSLRMARIALQGLLRDCVVIKDGQLVRLRD